MRFLPIISLVLAALTVPAAAQQTGAPVLPELQVRIEPQAALETNGYVQGQIVVQVQLISRYPFEALDLTLPQIPDADVVELLRPRTRKVTSYAGQGYVFEKSIAIVPRSSGVLTLPPVTAVGYVEPETDNELHFDLASDPVTIKVAGVARAFEHRWWLVSDRVEIEEEWSIPPEEIRVGETVTRTVHLRVWGVAAERLPELEHKKARGIRVSLSGSKLKTEKTPDGLIADATYTWDLIAEPQQVVFLKPVALDYWNPLEHRLSRAVLPALRLEPLPEDSEKIAAALMSEAVENRQWSMTFAAILVGVLSLPILIALGAFFATRIPTSADRRLRTAVSGGGAEKMYRALDNWFVESGWKPEHFEEASTCRSALSDQLFARGHPAGSAPFAVVSEAFRFSRQRRARQLVDWVYSFWYKR